MTNNVDEQLESPLNTPKFKKDRDKQARAALSKSGKSERSRAEMLRKADMKAERDSYKLNRRNKF